jgi:hypothetical protein
MKTFHPDSTFCLCFPLLDMCAYLPCYPTLFFTGGSRPPRTKASVHHEDHVPRRIRRERGPRKHVLEYNEEMDRYVQRSVAAQQARDAKAVEAQKKEAAKAERPRKPGFTEFPPCLISHSLSTGK